MGAKNSRTRPYRPARPYVPELDTEFARVLLGRRRGVGAVSVCLVAGLSPAGRFILERCGVWEEAVAPDGSQTGWIVRCRPGLCYQLRRWDGSCYWFVVHRGGILAVDERIAREMARAGKRGAR